MKDPLGKRPGRGFCKKLLLFVLLVELGFPYSLRATPPSTRANGTRPFLPPTAARASATSGLMPETERALAPPWLPFLAERPRIPLTMGLAANDPGLDADPFFLNAQRWVAASAIDFRDGENAATVAFATERRSFTIQLREGRRALRVDAPLRPLAFDERWVFLAANEASLFERGRDAIGTAGQGVFLISWEELEHASRTNARVPLYFFPLPGDGWTGGRVAAIPFPMQSLVVLVDGFGRTLPLEDDDVERVAASARLNLLLARSAALRSATYRNARIDVGDILPRAGSTFGFGLLFTGFDPDASLNLFPGLPQQASLFSRARTLMAGLLPKEARADEVEEATQKLLENVTATGTTLGVVIIAAVLLKYSWYFWHFEDRYAADVAAGRVAGTATDRLTRETRDLLNVVAHNLATLKQIPGVWTGDSIELIIDRYFPQLGASENSWIRRALNATVYYTRSVNEELPVDWKTLLLGGIAFGLTDTSWYAFQLYVFLPQLMSQVALAVPDLQARVDSTYSLANPATQAYFRNDLFGTLATNLAGGASALSLLLRTLVTNVEGPRIEEQMASEGHERHTADWDRVYEARLKARVAQVFESMRLPTKRAFLHDASLLIDSGRQLLGYPTVTTIEGEEEYLGRRRPGLIPSVTGPALAQAEADLGRYPNDPDLQAAVNILRQVHADVSHLRSWVSAPIDRVLHDVLAVSLGARPRETLRLAETVKRTREDLMRLTYDGPAGVAMRNVPDSWRQAVGNGGAQVAARYYRRAFLARKAGDATLLRGATTAQREALGPTAHAEIEHTSQAALEVAHYSQFEQLVTECRGNRAAAGRRLRALRATEYRLIFEEQEVFRFHVEVERGRPYVPPRRGREFVRAREEASWTFRTQRGYEFNPMRGTPQEQEADQDLWVSLYRRCLAQAVDVYPNFEGMENWRPAVETRAQALTTAQLSVPKVVQHLATLTPAARFHFKADFAAENYAKAYVEVISGSVDAEARRRYREQVGHDYEVATATRAETAVYKGLVRAVAVEPAQPGAFQLRRIQNRASGFWTRFYRGLETFFPTEAHRPGFWSSVFRRVPMLYDCYTASQAALRNSVILCTVGYLFNWAVWNVAFTAPIFVMCLLLRFTVDGPWQTLTRGFRLQGMTPLGSVMQMVLYASLFSWATMWGAVPVSMLEPEARAAWEAIRPLLPAIAGTAVATAACARVVALGVEQRQALDELNEVARRMRAAPGATTE